MKRDIQLQELKQTHRERRIVAAAPEKAMTKPLRCPIPAPFRRNCDPASRGENTVSVFEILSVDQVILAILTTAALREMLPVMLPASVAGPNGWLIQYDDDER